MAAHLISNLLPPIQRHWVGPDNLLGGDHVRMVRMPAPRHNQIGRDEMMTQLFWYHLANEPHLDGIIFFQ